MVTSKFQIKHEVDPFIIFHIEMVALFSSTIPKKAATITKEKNNKITIGSRKLSEHVKILATDTSRHFVRVLTRFFASNSMDNVLK